MKFVALAFLFGTCHSVGLRRVSISSFKSTKHLAEAGVDDEPNPDPAEAEPEDMSAVDPPPEDPAEAGSEDMSAPPPEDPAEAGEAPPPKDAAEASAEDIANPGDPLGSPAEAGAPPPKDLAKAGVEDMSTSEDSPSQDSAEAGADDDFPAESGEEAAPATSITLAKVPTNKILKEVRKRINCKKGRPRLAHLETKSLLGELAKRDGAKTCKPEKQDKKLVEKKHEEPVPAVAKKTTKLTTTTTTTTTPCPDNFMDELVDQANVEFKKLDQDGDGCITADELTVSLDKQKKEAKDRPQYYWKLKDVKSATKEHSKHMRKQIHEVDTNKNGCIDKEELEKVHFSVCDCSAQFGQMDHSGDKKISETEAANYVDKHMTHADLSHEKFTDIFAAADADKSGFLSKDEFCNAGPRYKGDGNNEP